MMLWMAVGFSLMFIVQVICLAALWWTTTELKAMQKSTHSIQYMPADAAFQKMTDEVRDSLTKDIFENVG
jgi:hypothetical protein